MIIRNILISIVVIIFSVIALFGLAGCDSSDSELGVSIAELKDGNEVWGLVKLMTKVSGDDIDSVKLYHANRGARNCVAYLSAEAGDIPIGPNSGVGVINSF